MPGPRGRPDWAPHDHPRACCPNATHVPPAGVGLLLVVALVWGSMFVGVQRLTLGLLTAELMAWRSLMATVPMLCLLRRTPSPHLWRHGASVGTLMFLVVGTQPTRHALTSASAWLLRSGPVLACA